MPQSINNEAGDDLSKSLLAAITTSSYDAIVSKNLDGIVMTWNKAAQRIFGYSAEEMIGRSISIIIPQDRADEEAMVLARIRRGETIDRYETVRRRKDGTHVDVSLIVSPVTDASGTIIGASKIARDVAEEKRNRERLRRSEERFRVTLESIGDAVICTDLQGRITFENRVAETFTGWRLHEAQGRPLVNCFNIINESTRQPVDDPVAKVLRHGTVVGLANHTILVAKDGTERPIDDAASPIRDSTGELIGTVLVFRDATSERAAHHALQQLAAIVEGSEDAIIGKDRNSIIRSWNKGAERIFGYTAEEAIGKSILLIIPPDRQKEEGLIMERLKRGERIEHYDTKRLTKDGNLITISLTLSPIRDAEGVIIGASKIAHDITARKEMEQALKAAQEQLQAYARDLEQTVQQRTRELQQSLSELESFSYSIAHDLRAPLRAMQQFSQVLLDDYAPLLDEAGKDYLHRIMTAGAHLHDLINDVLDYSRVIRSSPELSVIDLEQTIKTIISHQPSFQPPSALLEIQTPLLPVLGHSGFVIQCLSNLLSNAVKFVPPGTKPHIRIFTERVDSRTRLSIRDNGIGIAPEHQGRVFGLFERLSHHFEGTGIGLAIVQKAVQKMGGSVGVKSSPGEGSTFWIDFLSIESQTRQSGEGHESAK
jgi:PAS domain S-box-containing protein